MLVKILGFADILAIIALLLATVLPRTLVIIMALYLIFKGIAFMLGGSPFPSFFDFTSGLYLAAASYGISHWIPTLAVIIFLIQKAVLSFV